MAGAGKPDEDCSSDREVLGVEQLHGAVGLDGEQTGGRVVFDGAHAEHAVACRAWQQPVSELWITTLPG